MHRFKTLFTIIGFITIPLLGAMEWLTGPRYFFPFFYLLPISAITLFAGKKSGICASVISTMIWLIVDISWSARYLELGYHFLNLAVRLSLFSYVVFFIAIIKTCNEKLEVKVDEGSTALVQEIAERKRAEKALMESEEQYREIVERADIGISIIQDYIIQYVNKGFLKIYGRAEADIIGTPFTDYVHPAELLKVIERYKQRIASENISPIYETVILRKNGDTANIELNEGLITYKNKPADLVIVRDITERKQLEKQIRADLKEKDILLKEIHHRVKNNMQVIISMLSLQADENKDPGVRVQFKESQDRIHSMALVHEMLYKSEDLSKIDFGDYVQILINNIFHSCGPDRPDIHLDRDLEAMRISLDNAIPCGLIVQELVSNALKHAFPHPGKKKPIMRIGLHRKNSMLELTVADNGIGIPKKVDLKEPKTLGLRLINILGQQLQADIRLKNAEGTEFQIRFKDK